MHPVFDVPAAAAATPIAFVTRSTLGACADALGASSRRFVEAAAFKARPGQCLLLPAADGDVESVLFGHEQGAFTGLPRTAIAYVLGMIERGGR